ncbi:hypothetical protein U1Q18_052272 [Sarracenia purpurea var. burkii]
MKSSFSLVVLSTYAILRLAVASIDEQSNDNNVAGEDEWSEFPPRPGCDIDCYAMTNAYGKLGGGACHTNNVCDCTYAENPTLEGLWKERFHSPEDVLNSINHDGKLSRTVYGILAEPFETGSQIKENLKKHLPEPLYDQIQVIDTCPAAKMNPKFSQKGSNAFKKYVDNILSNELNSNDFRQLSEIELEPTLINALNDFKVDEKNFELLVSEIRRVQNESMTRILDSYLTKNKKQESTAEEKNPNEVKGSIEDKTVKNNESVEDVAEILSRTIINKLLEKVEKSTIEKIVDWVGEKLSFWKMCTSPTTIDDQVGLRDFVYVPDRFKLPSKFDRKKFQNTKAINKNWNEDTFKLRYRRNKEGDINLNWIKKSLMVSILKTKESNVNQNWVFGTTVRINMTRMAADGIYGSKLGFRNKKRISIIRPSIRRANIPTRNGKNGKKQTLNLSRRINRTFGLGAKRMHF